MAPPHTPLLPIHLLLLAVMVQNKNFMSNFSKTEFMSGMQIVNTRDESRNILSDTSSRSIRNTKSESGNIMDNRDIVKTNSELMSILEHLDRVARMLEERQKTPGQEEELEGLEEEWHFYQYYLQGISLEDQEKEQEWDFYQYYLDSIHR